MPDIDLDEIERLDEGKFIEARAREDRRIRAENDALRAIISQCAEAAGAAVGPECSIEFMKALPEEIRLGRVRRETEAQRRGREEMRERAASEMDELAHDEWDSMAPRGHELVQTGAARIRALPIGDE